MGCHDILILWVVCQFIGHSYCVLGWDNYGVVYRILYFFAPYVNNRVHFSQTLPVLLAIHKAHMILPLSKDSGEICWYLVYMAYPPLTLRV